MDTQSQSETAAQELQDQALDSIVAELVAHHHSHSVELLIFHQSVAAVVVRVTELLVN
jgi:hypothetical protein